MKGSRGGPTLFWPEGPLQERIREDRMGRGSEPTVGDHEGKGVRRKFGRLAGHSLRIALGT
jgi:hypothetical protein